MLKTKTIFPVVVLVLLICNLFAQDLDVVGNKKLTKAQAVEEYKLVYESLINYHPYPFMYTSKEALQQYFDEQLSSLQSQTTYRDMHLKIRLLIAKIKCGHTFARPSQEWYEFIHKTPSQFPFSVKQIEEKVYIKNVQGTDTGIEINDELIEINDMPIHKILEDMQAIQQRDGHTMSFVKSSTIRLFSTYFIFLYGVQNENKIKCRSKDGREYIKNDSVSIKRVPKQNLLQSKFSFETLQETKWSNYGVNTELDLAYMKITSFSDRKEFKDFYEYSFSQLQKQNVGTLILDLRGNTGGYFGNGNRLLTYLTEHPFAYEFHRPNKKLEKNKYTKLDIWNKLTRFAFSAKPGKNKIEGQKSYDFKYKPSKLLFTGDLHVLIDGTSFSQAALVSSQLHHQGVVFYGTESGGTESGTNSVVNHRLILPHSGIQVGIPYYRIVSNSEVDNFGYGIRPDHVVKPLVDETTDTTLDTVIEIILDNQ